MDLYQEQRKIEEEAALEGVRRLSRTIETARRKGREADTRVGGALVSRLIAPMVELLKEDLKKRSEGRATKGGPCLNVLRKLDPALMCIVAARAALATMSKPTATTIVARRIGDALEDECVWLRWETLNKVQAKAVRKRVNQSGSASQRRAATRGFAKSWQEGALRKPWSNWKSIAIGAHFIDYLVRLGVLEEVEIKKRAQKGKPLRPANAVQHTSASAEWLKEMEEFLNVRLSVQWPLVIPPKPWTAPQGGGFHHREDADLPCIPRPLKPLPLVRRAPQEQRELLAVADLSTVYDGLNAVQETAWRVNPKVYAVMAQLMSDGRGGPGLSTADPSPVPGRLSEDLAQDKTKLRAHKNEIRKVHADNARAVSKRFAQHRVFSVASKFSAYPAIHFAYNVDFRGRAYACSEDLSPQGNDLQRGLLEFAEGDKLTEDGARWLAVHTANCWGEDKVSFNARVEWARANERMILEVARDPLDCRAWHRAEDPWQFLAACFAWADYKERGSESLCRVAIMLDGSCSGIQHWSALLRDLDTGQAVNLVPGEAPGDLYREVAERVREELANSPRCHAQDWRAWSGLSRKIVKQSVMVMPYGGQFISTLESVREAVRKVLEKEPRPSWLTEEAEKEAFKTLAKAVWEAQRSRVKGPREGMDYVKSLVRTWAKAASDRKLYWIAPSGFPFLAHYQGRGEKLMARVTINGARKGLSYYNPLPEIDWAKVETTTAPNFIHALDAAHLIKSLQAARRAGITKLAAVHDAFGTTPSRTSEFAELLRQTFAKLYENDPLETFVETVRGVGGEPPDPPSKGALVVADIARSEYLFA